ncbi:MAG: EthD domain-containing protein [SAR324 cluster bacterium]|nr:EthD domain-containing protein [SAR324 cluster bacterium]
MRGKPEANGQTQMIKLSFCLKRQAHLTREAFLDYWLNTHGPLVRRHAKALNIHRYVQHHNQDDPLNEGMRAGRGAPEPFDGVAELWWKSRAELEQAFSTPQGRRAGKELLEDEARFIELKHSPLWLGEEKTIVG